MKNKTILKLFIIILAGLFFRIWLLDKPEGLWFDEYVSWYTATKNNLSEFLTLVFRNCHMPLYYIYLKLWLLIFPDTDLSLRWSSVVPSLASIPLMYLLGKELFNNKNTGLLCALFTALSSFLIYFAQEVRLYSIIFLVSAAIALYFVRSVRNPSKGNFILFLFYNFILCALHTLGIIFSFFIITSLLTYLYKFNNQCKDKILPLYKFIKYIFPFLLVMLILSPFLISIAFSKNLSQFWSNFSYTKILCVFVDYFSPIQTNIINTPESFIKYIYSHARINLAFIIFGIIPTLICISALIKSVLNKNKILNYLLCSCLGFFAVLIFFALAGKIILITKYTTEIYPILILAVISGLESFRKKNLRNILIVGLILLNLFYIYNSDTAVQRRTRPEGHRAVTELIKHSRLTHNDTVILTYYDLEKFKRYFNENDTYKFDSINKYNFNNVLFNNNDYHIVISQGKTIYKDYFDEIPNKKIIKYTNDKYIKQMKKGDRVGIIILKNVSFLSNEDIKRITADDSVYERTPFIFLVFSSLKNNLLYAFKKELKLDSITTSGDWTLYVYVKT